MTNMARIVETDNFGRDDPDESFLAIPNLPVSAAERICEILNDAMNPNGHAHDRYWKAVTVDYKLVPGFEP